MNLCFLPHRTWFTSSWTKTARDAETPDRWVERVVESGRSLWLSPEVEIHRVIYLWSVHDFMGYYIFAAWSIHERLTCPICGLYTNCFCLTSGSKIWGQIGDVLPSSRLVQIVLKQIWCHTNQCMWQEASLQLPHVGPCVTCSGPGGHRLYYGEWIPPLWRLTLK
jgi:hypothetical protein